MEAVGKTYVEKWKNRYGRNEIFSTGVVWNLNIIPQDVWKDFCVGICPQQFIPQSTGAVEFFWTAKYLFFVSAALVDRCHFLVAEQESNQRSRCRGGATKKRPPLRTPPAASPTGVQKCPDF